MNCTHAKKEIDALLDSELEPMARSEVLAHLERCGDCRAEYETLRQLSGDIQQKLPVSTPDALDRKVLAAMTAALPDRSETVVATSPGWLGFNRLAFAFSVGAVLIAGGLGFGLGRMSAGNYANAASISPAPIQRAAAEPAPKIIEVPVYEEKIVRVPEVRERIVTRTVSVCEEGRTPRAENLSFENEIALQNTVRDGEYLTNANLEGFQPVSEIKMNINRRDEEK